ncbi:zinc-finger protein conserved [Leptomonas pyrrhocoris]|uniref:Zinc-finger protein conserved n=1 Tax=Leptomonas pyrrhocoris TaxID=157538 RepID=A0A0M9G6J0_LEPPY|nr:zinc-finger protein conserved [Leptomonas pyrrhocoris]KPA83296.1 zinc-finger protein conserved [Leptomonas pyrrhocoris]|eukprot:XP_015661735.1 zinc-finger protein conserved [Leptomonas pyrrhocoris]
MPFTFKLHEPPCDVAFLSIVDGEALYNADNARTRDVKEATIRQIGWHRVELPQEWFLSQRARETTTHMLEAMQCTLQYLRYRGKSEEKRSIRLAATLQRCEEERAAAFEELIELRETVALYKKKLREMSQGTKRGAPSPVTHSEGLQCAFCENCYPSRHALESHFRKRHKRSSGYAAMAAAAAAVAQKQQQQEVKDEALTPRSPSNLPFMGQRSPPPSGSTTSPPGVESRGDLSLREELSELRLSVAKLLTQQAEFYRGMSPSCMAAVPMPTATAPGDAPAVTRTTPVATGPLPGLPSSPHASKEEESALLRWLAQDVSERKERRGGAEPHAAQRGTENNATEGNEETPSRPPADVTARVRTYPTLDPRSFLHSSGSDSVLGGGGGTGVGARRGSTMDSYVEVSPMSPSPSLAQHANSREKKKNRTRRKHGKPAAETAVLAAGFTALAQGGSEGIHGSVGLPSALLERQRLAGLHEAHGVASLLSSSAQVLIVSSEHGSFSGESTASSSIRPALDATHTPPAGNGSPPAPVSPENAKLLAYGPDTDSPMVRLPSSTDALTRGSSEPNSPSANRYGTPSPPDSGETSHIASIGLSAGGPTGTSAAGAAASAQFKTRPAPQAVKPLSPVSTQQGVSNMMLLKKTYGPVPSVPILRVPSSSSSSSSSLPSTDERETNLALPSPQGGSGIVSAVSAGRTGGVVRTDTTTPRRRVPDTSSPHPGVQSPTQTPRFGSTPPTTRVAPIPALNLSAVSVHSSTDQPRRSDSPSVSRASHRHGDAAERQAQRASATDAVVQASLNSSTGALQAGFTPATQAPTQKAIPVVHLVPATSLESDELGKHANGDEKSDSSGDASVSSFSKVPAGTQPERVRSDAGQSVMQTRRRQSAEEVLRASDASYSVDAQLYAPSDAEQEEEDALDADQHEAYIDNASDHLPEDITVDPLGSVLSQDVDVDGDDQVDRDPIMEDVLTNDLVPAEPLGPLFGTYPAPMRRQVADTASDGSEEEDVVDAGGDVRSAEDASALHSSDAEHRNPQHAVESGSGGSSEEVAKNAADKAESASGDYSYYTDSYDDDEGSKESEEGEWEAKNSSGGKLDMESSKFSLGTPVVAPPMAVSPTVASSRGGDRFYSPAQAEAHVEKKPHKRGKETAAATPGRESGRRSSSELLRGSSTEMTRSEELASVPPARSTSFQSNVSHTVKKAGGVFKNLFTKKKKR